MVNHFDGLYIFAARWKMDLNVAEKQSAFTQYGLLCNTLYIEIRKLPMFIELFILVVLVAVVVIALRPPKQ
jgi:hypothetical protein